MGSRSPSIARWQIRRASSSGLMVALPLLLRVIHASSKAVSRITRVSESKDQLPIPSMFPPYIEVARNKIFWSLPQKVVEFLELPRSSGDHFQIEATEHRGNLGEPLDQLWRTAFSISRCAVTPSALRNGRSRSDFGSALLVARRMPLRDGVKDNLGREQSHLSKVRIANCLTFNSLPLRLQIAFRLLQLSDQSVDFCNRRGSDFLNERRDHLRVSFCLRGKLRIGEIANFSSNRQICG